jgi:hypothetical protein
MRRILLYIAAVLTSVQLQSQNITNYTFSPSSGTFIQLAGGTTASLSGGNFDDGWFNNIPIGFTFFYMGIAYTSVSISTNGWLTFGQNIGNSYSGNSLSNSPGRLVIAPLWDDLSLQSNTNFSYMTSGSSPNRVFTSEWLNIQWSRSASGNTISFQVKLNEIDRKIEFIYRQENGAVSSGSASIGISASTSGPGSYLSLGSSGTNPTVSSATETTSIATKPANGQVYAFSPLFVTPADPSSMTYTAVTQTGMTVNWVDNSSTESYFLVYFSYDGVTYTQVGNITSTTISGTGTSYSYTQSGLLPGITYYFRVTANNEGGPPSGFLAGSNSTSDPGDLTTIANGNWTDGTIWSTGTVPTSLDNVSISDGITVNIDGTAICNALYVGQGVSGLLRFGTTATSLTTIHGITVAIGGVFDAGAANGADLSHNLNVGGSSQAAMGTGSLLVEGTFDMFIGNLNGKCTVNFFGKPQATVSGSGAIDFYRIVLNKGEVTATETVIPPILEILASFTGSGVATTGVLYTHTAGTLKIGGTFSQTNPVYLSASYSIPVTGAFWLSNPEFSVSGQAGTANNYGLVKLSAGIYNVGTDNSHTWFAGTWAVFLIENGTMNISGRFAPGNTFIYKQTGGIVNVATAGNAVAGSPGFGISNYPSTFNMSGGTICIVNANVASGTKIDYQISTNLVNISGGTLQLGNASSGTAKTFLIKSIAPNLVLNNSSAGHSCNLADDLTIKGNLVLNGTGAFSTNGYNLTLPGLDASSPGNITINAGCHLTLNSSSSKVLTFNSSFGNQVITNNGTITGNQLPGLNINNTFGGGGTVTIPGGLTIMGNATLNLVKGTLNLASGLLTFGSGGTTGFTCIRTDGAVTGSCSSNFGSGAVNYTYNGTVAQITGPELPASFNGQLTISNVNGVSLNSSVQAGILNLAAGVLTVIAPNTLTITGTAN